MHIKAPNYGLPSPWQPISDSRELAVLGKLAEELCECGTAVSRCIIQGADENHPVTGKNNGEWMFEEIADVLAGFDIALEHFSVSPKDLEARIEAKKAHLRQWHKGIK